MIGEDTEMADVPDNMPENAANLGGTGIHKRKRNDCTVKNNKRRMVKCYEDKYYTNNEYLEKVSPQLIVYK